MAALTTFAARAGLLVGLLAPQLAAGSALAQTCAPGDLSRRYGDEPTKLQKAKGGETAAEAELPEPGEYYIEVRDGGNDARRRRPRPEAARKHTVTISYNADTPAIRRPSTFS